MNLMNAPTSTISTAVAARLTYELNCARIQAPEDIHHKVVTMNSTVMLRDRVNGDELEVTVTYPNSVDVRTKRISVFSPTGIALLGRRVGTIIGWNTPAGLRQFEIVDLLYQPEAVGDYSQ